MKTYNQLLTTIVNRDKSYWEHLSNNEKEQIETAYILQKSVVIPCETSFQKIVLNIRNVIVDELSHEELKSEFITVQNLLFQSIKEDVERDLETEEIEQLEASKWLSRPNHGKELEEITE